MEGDTGGCDSWLHINLSSNYDSFCLGHACGHGTRSNLRFQHLFIHFIFTGMMADKIGIKVAGALAGLVYLPSLESTVQELKEEIGSLLGFARVSVCINKPYLSYFLFTPTVTDPTSLKLLLGGRNLQDNHKKISEVGINANSKDSSFQSMEHLAIESPITICT
eukprot:1138474-Pelagomonas_calceolata.AAC.8